MRDLGGNGVVSFIPMCLYELDGEWRGTILIGGFGHVLACVGSGLGRV